MKIEAIGPLTERRFRRTCLAVAILAVALLVREDRRADRQTRELLALAEHYGEVAAVFAQSSEKCVKVLAGLSGALLPGLRGE